MCSVSLALSVVTFGDTHRYVRDSGSKILLLSVQVSKLSTLCYAHAAPRHLTATGLHTHVRTHRTSSDPAYLQRYVYLYIQRKKKDVAISGIGLKFGYNGFTENRDPTPTLNRS